MENQHRKIKGYRELTQVEIDLMNRIKAFGPELDTLVKDIDAYLASQTMDALTEGDAGRREELDRIDTAQPGVWMEEGRVSLQKGLMFLTRAVAQPTFF